jgi:hypothetical protein
LNRQWARKVNLLADVTYLTNQDGLLDTRQWLLEASNDMDSGDQIRFQVSRNFERILPDDAPFVINARDRVIIPAGDYGFNRYLIGYQGFAGAAFVPAARFERGEFYGGNRNGLFLSGTWAASPHLMVRGDYEFNEVSLPQGTFDTHLWRARFSMPVTARATADAFVQWNGLNQQGDQELNTQVRFHLIYGRDSNLFVVFNDQRRDLGGGVIARDQAIQMKMTYRFYW